MEKKILCARFEKEKLIQEILVFTIYKKVNNASFGTNINYGAFFKSPPILPHHLNGIIVSPNSKIGDNCIIFQQVTLAQDDDGFAPSIGDNVLIGAGAKIIGNVKIGNNVKIGSNCIVVEDIPDNATVVMNKPRIICKNI